MKTKEELNALKEEVETLNKKLHELTDEQLEKVNGGITDSLTSYCPNCNTLLGRWITFTLQQVEELDHNTVKCPVCNWKGIVANTNRKATFNE